MKKEEIRLKRKGNGSFIGSVSAVAVKDEEGKIKYFDGIVEDITERKKIQEALTRSEEKYRFLCLTETPFSKRSAFAFLEDIKT